MAFPYWWFALAVLVLIISSRTANAQTDDSLAMMGLRQELAILNWTTNRNYCSWAGVSCSPDGLVESLNLSHFQLDANISYVTDLKALKYLDLSMNHFSGQIPSKIGELTHLVSLDLSTNLFDGSIPVSLSSLIQLEYLNLSRNLLSGQIPNELGSLEKLQELQLYGNKLNGTLPSWLGNLPKLKVLTAYENRLEGRIPQNLSSASDLQILNLHTNHLIGPIPESIFASGKLEVLILAFNNLSGSLPASIGNCKGLSNLRIGSNMIAGTIPTSVGNITSLTYFDASGNDLSGTIIPQISQCLNLSLLNLGSNKLTGAVPPMLGDLVNLQELILSDNNLIGDIPKNITRCMNLSKLDLSGNQLNGSIPEEICNMGSLQYLLLNENFLQGVIPSEIGNCKQLLILELAGNELMGNIPAEIGRISNLEISLNLSVNRLYGLIPPELGKLSKLVTLDLSYNQLFGNIPRELSGMSSLLEVNFSHNHLHGPIPIFAPFQNSPSSCFEMNDGLCGYPINACSASNDFPGRRVASYRNVLIGIGSCVIISAFVMVLVLLFMAKEKREVSAAAASVTADVSSEGNMAAFPTIVAGSIFVDSLKQAVDFRSAIMSTLNDSNKLTCGTLSTSYRAVMPSGLVLTVKKLKSMEKAASVHLNKVIRELERLGRISQPNVLRPIGFIIYEDVVLLLYYQYENGTLGRLLHCCSESKNEVDWPTRLNIAIGVAEGLAFLHHLALTHMDVSSGNVLLDANLNPLVGEIEVSKLLDPSRCTASLSAVAGSFGYIPPEYAYTMRVTSSGNVYSYGVLLLEILTSRMPVEEAFGEGMDLVKWVQSGLSRGEAAEQIMDVNLSTISFAWRKQMLAALHVAIMCTDCVPTKRPKMKKVVEMLQDVKRS